MNRLRSVFRFTRHTAFWFCCVMAVVCFAVLLAMCQCDCDHGEDLTFDFGGGMS